MMRNELAQRVPLVAQGEICAQKYGDLDVAGPIGLARGRIHEVLGRRPHLKNCLNRFRLRYRSARGELEAVDKAKSWLVLSIIAGFLCVGCSNETSVPPSSLVSFEDVRLADDVPDQPAIDIQVVYAR